MYTAAIYNAYRDGTLSIRMEALSLLYEAAICNSFNSNGHGRLCTNLEVYLLYTTAIYNP